MIILCEPQCHSFEHAAFNAALLATACIAFPDDEIIFLGEPNHLLEVEGVLKAAQVSCARVAWHPVEIPPTYPAGVRRLPEERKLIQSVFAVARSTQAQSVLFSSATEVTILALKQMLRKLQPCNVQVVLHGVLGTLLEQRWRNPRRWGFSLRQALYLPHPPQLKYIVLSESIHAHAIRIEPRLKNRLYAIDMPHLWDIPTREMADLAALNSNTCVSRPVNFGYFGKTIKGFPRFYEIASEIKAKQLPAQFSLVGFLNGYDLQCPYEESVVGGLSRMPLSQMEYSRRAMEVDYAVWLADPAHYSLTASATFLDALNYLKPIIYLANPYIDAYAEKFGDIGYRCQTLTEMKATIEEIARSFPANQYYKQRAAILKGRTRFEPSIIAPALKSIMQQSCATQLS
jgi:hypothetical protein